MDDATEQAGSNRESNDGQETEFLVKWQVPGTDDVAAAKRKLIQAITTLLVAFPAKITIIDRKQQEWMYQESTNEDQFRSEAATMNLQLYPIKNKDQKVLRWVTIIKTKSTKTIQDWKNDDEFYTQASESKIYLVPHPFGYDEWEVVSIGFIKDHHAVHYPKEHLHAKIQRLLLQDQTTTPPTFQLVPQRVTTKDSKATTKAYTVQCLKKKSDQLAHLLTHGNFRQAPNQMFVPFKYKMAQPDLFLKCIRQQNDIYHKTWIIKLEGITSDAMTVLEDKLLQLNGVYHVVPSKRYQLIGEWKILVEQTRCSYIHRTLVKNWTDLMDNIPNEIREQAPTGFPSPSVSSRKLREYQDDASDIDSYGSLLSVGTETSTTIQTDENLDELPLTYQYPTYAAVIGARTSNSSQASTQISSPNTSAYLDWQKEKQDIESQLQKQAALFEQELDNRFKTYTETIEKLQLELQAKISRSQDLEERLAQALDLAYDRDARHEEMMNKFDLLLNMQHESSQSTAIAVPNTSPGTPLRANPSPSSPPSKRKNTNATPHRSMYSIFRTNQETTTTASRSRNQAPQSNQKTLPSDPNDATMDVDEELQEPQPEATTGNTQE